MSGGWPSINIRKRCDSRYALQVPREILVEMGHLRMVQREVRNCVGDAFDGMMEEILQLVKCGIEKAILIVISSSFAMFIDQNSILLCL